MFDLHKHACLMQLRDQSRSFFRVVGSIAPRYRKPAYGIRRSSQGIGSSILYRCLEIVVRLLLGYSCNPVSISTVEDSFLEPVRVGTRTRLCAKPPTTRTLAREWHRPNAQTREVMPMVAMNSSPYAQLSNGVATCHKSDRTFADSSLAANN